MNATVAKSDREMIITRLISAPRELVFAAWTDPHHIGQWWGPTGFTTTVHSMDVRPDGEWIFTMHGPDGVDYANRIVYEEIVRPERLTYRHDANVEDDPGRFHSVVTFEDESGKTRVTLRATFVSAEECERARKFGAVEGGNQTLARLAAFLLSHHTA